MPTTLRGAAAFLLAAILLGSCSSGSTSTTNTQTMTKNAGDNQSATVGTVVATKPSVKITDQNGAAVSGVSVTFAVVSGGGSVAGGSTTTGSDGVATIGNWTLGATAGANTLTASASGVTGSPVTFTATGTAVAAPVAVAMTKQGGDAQSAAVSTAVTNAPSVKLVDISGNPVASVAVTFAVASGGGSITGSSATTNALGIAAVGSWTLGATAGANTLTATAAGSGIAGNPATFTATATAAVFSPTGSVSIGGTLAYSSMNIPAGVTVTLSGDAVITVSGAVTIAGTISGDCKNLSITATGVLASTGNINNTCSATPGTPPAITIVAQGGYHVTGGTWTLSGALNLTNDATLTDATFPAPPVGIRTFGNGGGAHLLQVGVCTVAGGAFVPAPPSAAPGTNGGPVGGAGKDGSTWVLQCTGELDLTGGTAVNGQNGGAGGTATDTRGTGASATGGLGGKGGTIKVRANNGDLVITGAGTNIQSGNGGVGGAATATATQVGNPGGSAGASGGNGNGPGNIVLQSRNGAVTITGTVTLTMGSAGNGGNATATAANGQTTPICPAGVGGAATAISGNGGSTPAATLTATGAVSGLGNVTVAGGAAGVGGVASSFAGIGGNGSLPCPPGGTGGANNATAGKGGDALIRNALGALIANGGIGGAMFDANGNGGSGWSDCGTPLLPGGAGGAGGAAGGRNGVGGSGLANGANGTSTFNLAANGGRGGDGSGPGPGGAAGANTANITAPPGSLINGSFNPGAPGSPCHPAVKLKHSSIPNTGGVVSPGTNAIQILDQITNAVVGAINVLTDGIGQWFVGTAPERFGNAPNTGQTNGWLYDLGSTTVNSLPYVFDDFTVCFYNAQIDAVNTADIIELDANNNVLVDEVISSPNLRAGGGAGLLNNCHTHTKNSATTKVRVKSKGTIDHGFTGNGHRGGPP